MAAGLATLFGVTSVLGLGLIPLLAIGLTVFRYNSVDPESHPQNAQQVLNLDFKGTYKIRTFTWSIK